LDQLAVSDNESDVDVGAPVPSVKDEVIGDVGDEEEEEDEEEDVNGEGEEYGDFPYASTFRRETGSLTRYQICGGEDSVAPHRRKRMSSYELGWPGWAEANQAAEQATL
jgi:hypothetical protein